MFNKIMKAASVPSKSTQYIQGCFNRLEDRLNIDKLVIAEEYELLGDKIEIIKEQIIGLQYTQEEILYLLHRIPTLRWILQQEQETKKPQDNKNFEAKLNESMRIDRLPLSSRSMNCLNNEGIKTVRELITKTDEELLKSVNFGRKSLNEIKEALKELGLTLGMKL
jgi:DNA-directed RNA polymerase alpha subunit